MPQKQDCVNSVLAQRISQLEEELCKAQYDLSAAIGQKDRAEDELKLLKHEALEVVEQWSAENTELRRKLLDMEKNNSAEKAALANREEMVACLKEELDVAQQLALKYSTDIQEEQQKYLEVERKNTELLESLASAERDLSSSSQRVMDFEHLVSKFQAELKDMLAARKADAAAIDHLRASLAQATAENDALRNAGENVSSGMERLLASVKKLNEENESLRNSTSQLVSAKEKLAQQLQSGLNEQRTLAEQVELLTVRLVTSEDDVRQHRENCRLREQEFATASAALQESQATAEQQLKLIQVLESDIAELKDREITTGRVLCDLQAELLRLGQQLDETSKQKEDLETEFHTIKESYATTLIDFDNYKRTSSDAFSAVQAEFAAFRRDSTERCILAEQNCSSAWLSVQELTDALRVQQLSEVVHREQIARHLVLLDHKTAINGVLEKVFHAVVTQLSESCHSLQRAEERIQQNELTTEKIQEQTKALSNRCRASEQTVIDQRKALSMLESQLRHHEAHLNEVVHERETFSKDNAWLRNQVESMRQELGELDELLSTNLNEMREENERLQLENDSLKQGIATANKKEHECAARITALQASVMDLENELRVQAKTLEITEAELQALKAQVENVSTSLDFSRKKCEELEAANTEAAQSNSSLTLQLVQLQEHLGNQDSKLSFVLSEKRKEGEGWKQKLNAYAEKCKKCEQQLRAEVKARKEVESAGAAAKEQNVKLRNALDDLKTRCAANASTIKELLAERDDVVRDRDIIVEKYNKLHDAFRNARREAHGKVADELRRVMELAMSQENELQALRQQNLTLKKSISMFVESAQPKAEAVFMERLNLTEGPLRHPKKRSATSNTEQQ
ncbi:hypothetical protein LSCM1_00776 [Leishmania martiniquensis]|uniref:Uncharacterized protein n=1 Tax=Leishmania martiniquensis TaxID=1580590 RepID=A0A836KAP6_9TRYP|nr:hypothetical protein LSCM1_00776 [Leishmania martiniquensis]